MERRFTWNSIWSEKGQCIRRYTGVKLKLIAQPHPPHFYCKIVGASDRNNSFKQRRRQVETYTQLKIWSWKVWARQRKTRYKVEQPLLGEVEA